MECKVSYTTSKSCPIFHAFLDLFHKLIETISVHNFLEMDRDIEGLEYCFWKFYPVGGNRRLLSASLIYIEKILQSVSQYFRTSAKDCTSST